MSHQANLVMLTACAKKEPASWMENNYESELVILLGIHSEVTADLSPVSARTRRGRWADCGVERQSGKWNRQLENPFAIAFFLRLKKSPGKSV